MRIEFHYFFCFVLLNFVLNVNALPSFDIEVRFLSNYVFIECPYLPLPRSGSISVVHLVKIKERNVRKVMENKTVNVSRKNFNVFILTIMLFYLKQKR